MRNDLNTKYNWIVGVIKEPNFNFAYCKKEIDNFKNMGGKLDQKYGSTKTLLNVAVEAGNLNAVELLAGAGASMNDALFSAVEHNKVDIVTWLLKNKPEIKNLVVTKKLGGLDKKITALDIALNKKITAIAKKLVDAEVDIKDAANLKLVATITGAAHYAAKKGYLVTIKEIIANDVKAIEKLNKEIDGKTALDLAIQNKHSGIVNELMSKEISFAHSDSFNEFTKLDNCMHYAAKTGNTAFIDWVGNSNWTFTLMRKPDMNKEIGGKTALDIALENNKDAAAKALMKQDAKLTDTNLYTKIAMLDGAFHYAAKTGDLGLSSHLVLNNIDKINNLLDGKTPLDTALLSKQAQSITVLMDHDAKFTSASFSKLAEQQADSMHYAAKTGNTEFVKWVETSTWVISSKPDKNKIFDGKTALDVALQSNNLETAKEFMKYNAEVKGGVTSYNILLTLDEALQYAIKMGDAALTDHLINNGFDIHKLVEGHSALDEALTNKNNALAQKFMDQGVQLKNITNIEAISKFLSTPYYAARVGNKEIIKALINKKDVDLNKVTDSKLGTVLDIALKNNHPEVAKLLMDANVKVTLSDNYAAITKIDGIAEYAARIGDAELVESIISTAKSEAIAANPSLTSTSTIITPFSFALTNPFSSITDASTALDIALIHEKFDVVKLLMEEKIPVSNPASYANFAKLDNCMHYAAKTGNTAFIEAVSKWWSGKPDINRVIDGKTALDLALESDEIIAAQKLMDQGGTYQDHSLDQKIAEIAGVIHYAIKIGNTTLVEYLIQNKPVSLKDVDASGHTVLDNALLAGKQDLVNKLIDAEVALSNKDQVQIFAKFVDYPNCLHYAAKVGNVVFIEWTNKLIAGKPDINKLIAGKTPLDIALANGKEDAVKSFMAQGAKIEDTTSYDAIIKVDGVADYAAKVGNSGLIKHIIKVNKALLDGENAQHKTPLDTALAKAHADAAKLLMNEDLKVTDASLYSAIKSISGVGHYAIRQGNNDLIKYLAKEDKTIFEQLENGKNSLEFALSIGKLDIAKQLMDLDNNLKIQDAKLFQAVSAVDEAIHYAARVGDSELTKFLIKDKPALLNLQDSKGNTPLSISIDNKNLETSKQLMDALVAQKTNIKDYIIKAIETNDSKFVEWLSEKPEFLKLQFSGQGSMLKVALNKGNTELAKTIAAKMISNKIDIKAEIEYAILRDVKEFINWLGKEHPKITSDSSEGSLLDKALNEGNIDVAKSLMDQGVDFNNEYTFNRVIKDIEGVGEYAVKKGYIDLIKYLIKEKPEQLYKVDDKGKTLIDSLDMAIKQGNNEITKILIEHFIDKKIDITKYIHLAIKEGDADLVDWIIKDKSEYLRSLDSSKVSTLENAFAAGKIDTAIKIIDSGKVDLKVIVSDAIKAGKGDFLEAFIKNNKIDALKAIDFGGGKTALDIAIAENKAVIQQKLIEADFAIKDPSLYSKVTNLPGIAHYAIRNGDGNLIDYLITNKSPKIIELVNNKSAVDLALELGKGDIAKKFMGADVEIKDGTNFIAIAKISGVFHYAAKIGNSALIEHLLLNNKNLINAMENGKTPLDVALINGQNDVVSKLMSVNANLGHDDAYNNFYTREDSMHYAAKIGNVGFFKYVDAFWNTFIKPDINKVIDGKTPLDIALENGHNVIISDLIGKKAIVEDSQHSFPKLLNIKGIAFYAIKVGNIKLIDYIIQNNKDAIKILDKDGSTTLDSALKESNFDIAQKLMDQGIEVEDVTLFNALSKVPGAVSYAVKVDNLAFIKYIAANYQDKITPDNIIEALKGNELEMAKFITESLLKNNKDVTVAVSYANSSNKAFSDWYSEAHPVNITQPSPSSAPAPAPFTAPAPTKPTSTLSKAEIDKLNKNLEYHVSKTGDAKAIHDLLEQGADANFVMRGEHKGYLAKQPVLASIVKHIPERHEIIQDLIKHGANVNMNDNTGNPIITYALKNADSDLFKELTKDHKEVLNKPLIIAAMDDLVSKERASHNDKVLDMIKSFNAEVEYLHDNHIMLDKDYSDIKAHIPAEFITS